MANLSIAVGLDPSDTEFNNIISENKANGTIKEAQGKILFTLEMIIVSYLSSVQFQSTNVLFFFSLYVGCLIFRIWNTFYPNLPSAQQLFPFFNITSSASVILIVTSVIEGAEIFGFLSTESNSTVEDKSTETLKKERAARRFNIYIYGYIMIIVAILINFYHRCIEFKQSSEVLTLKHYTHF